MGRREQIFFLKGGETGIATPPREEGFTSVIVCSSEPVPPLKELSLSPIFKGANLTGESFRNKPYLWESSSHHSPTKVQAGRIVTDTQHLVYNNYHPRERDSNLQPCAWREVSPSNNFFFCFFPRWTRSQCLKVSWYKSYHIIFSKIKNTTASPTQDQKKKEKNIKSN